MRNVAIVTGAGGDIGRAIAQGLLEDGYAVLASDIDLARVQASVDALAGTGRVIAANRCDVTDPASVAAMTGAARELGTLCVLVNNAGGVTDDSLQSASIENWRLDSALNLEGPLNCFKSAQEDLKASKGVVINIASINGLGVFGHPGYSAAKAGLIHLTRMIAVEYGQFGIRANTVAPGTVETRAWAARAQANPNVMAEARRWYPLRRIARPEDIAHAVRFLASPNAAAISGVCLPVDCGLMAGQAELAGTFSQSGDYSAGPSS